MHILSSGEIFDLMNYIPGSAPKQEAYQSRVLSRWDEGWASCDDIRDEEERRLPTRQLRSRKNLKEESMEGGAVAQSAL